MPRRMADLSTDLKIMAHLEHGACHGVSQLMLAMELSNYTFLRKHIAKLQRAGMIELVIPPSFGRGHKIIIQKAQRG